MSFVTACVRPARVFMSTLLNTLRLSHGSRFCFLSKENKSDLRWWSHFLPLYNGVSLIKPSPWRDDPWHLSTDACNTGPGGYFNGQFLLTLFPAPILHHFGDNINVLEGGTEALASSSTRPTFHPSLRQQQQRARPQFRPLKNTRHATLHARDLVFVCVTRFRAHRYPHSWT